jgi:hypothetical protein
MDFAARACQAIYWKMVASTGRVIDTYVLPVQIESAQYAVGPACLAVNRFPAPSALVWTFRTSMKHFFAKFKDVDAPEEEETALADRLQQRMNQLGYKMWEEDTESCLGCARFEQPWL